MNPVDLRQLAIDRGREEAPPHRRARRHVLTRYVLPSALLVALLGLVARASRDVVFPPRPVTVVPVLATPGRVLAGGAPLFKAAGWIEPRPTPVRVAALAPGVVEQLLVVQDQPVAAGQAVATLVAEDARLALERAQADLRLREAEAQQAAAVLAAAQTRLEQPVHLEAALGEAEAALAQIETQLTSLPYELRRAQAHFDFARKDYERKASSAGAVAATVIDEALSESEAAQALIEGLRQRAGSLQRERAALSRRRDALRKQLDLLAEEIRARDEAQAQMAAAAARVEQARVALAEAELRLERMTVRAPVEGRVYQLLAQPGTTLTAGMGRLEGADGSTVITLYQPHMLQVRADVRFEDLPNVALGQDVRIENPALASPLTGRVLFIGSEANIQKNTLEVRIEIEHPPPVLKPDMLVDVTFLSQEAAGHDPADQSALPLHLSVPRELVRVENSSAFVWLADRSAGVARKVAVQTGRASGDGLVEVLTGLKPGDRLIVTGSDGLRDGDRIRVIGEEPPAAGHAPPG